MGFVGDIVSGVADILPDPLGIGNMLGLTSQSKQGPQGPAPQVRPPGGQQTAQGFMGSMMPNQDMMGARVGQGGAPGGFRVSQWNDPNKNRI